MTLLERLRVLDLSTDIAGPYATKLLCDAGADVVKAEPPGGDPLRRWTASHQDLAGEDGALFRFLNTSKRSVVTGPDDPAFHELAASADVIVESGRLEARCLADLRERHPRLGIVSISAFGRTGPYADAPATEFTLQAWSGSTAGRGRPARPPLHAAGRIGEWIAGTYAAIGGLAAHRNGGGHVDLSILECTTVTLGSFATLFAGFSGMLDAARTFDGPVRTVELPSIYPTSDGLVGFCTITGQQFEDFLVLIERPDLLGDDRYALAHKRARRAAEFDRFVTAWTTTRTTDEIIDAASAFRIPVTAIGTPATITAMEHFTARGIYVDNPGGGFEQPRVPYQVTGVDPAPFRPAPGLDEHHGAVEWAPKASPTLIGPPGRPLAGVRIVDLTAFWAGPSATHVLAALGAEVIKVEGPRRPDGMRFSSTRGPEEDDWWEASPVFHAVNTGKRAITLDLGSDDGRAILLDLVERSDGLIENFSPRVLDGFGITWEAVHARNPRAVMMRMPSFGLDGPWRDRTGFAQTMEQVSGMAWLTGFADDLPVVPRGVCDPLAGMHATFAFLAALHERERSGEGRFIEISMVEAALNCAAELVVEHGAYGVSLHRAGNRGPAAAPQGIYACAGTEQWLALAVTDDDQWTALVDILGCGDLADVRFASAAGRRRHHDELDVVVGHSVAGRERDELVARLLGARIPAAPVLSSIALLDHPQLRHRGFFETIDHPVVGTHDLYGLPFRLSTRTGPWLDGPAPTLGQHNTEILGGLLGRTPADLDHLQTLGVTTTTLAT